MSQIMADLICRCIELKDRNCLPTTFLEDLIAFLLGRVVRRAFLDSHPENGGANVVNADRPASRPSLFTPVNADKLADCRSEGGREGGREDRTPLRKQTRECASACPPVSPVYPEHSLTPFPRKNEVTNYKSGSDGYLHVESCRHAIIYKCETSMTGQVAEHRST